MSDTLAPPKTLFPVIRQVPRVEGHTLSFRNAVVDDAEFILSLRTDENKSRYLNATSNDVVAQRTWLANYATGSGQVYFIIEHANVAIGTVRLYDAQGDSFCWGSWILKEGRPKQAAVESALMVYAYAIDYLGFKAAHFDVRKGNERVLKFHERFQAKRVGENELDYFYILENSAIRDSFEALSSFLPEGVHVVE